MTLYTKFGRSHTHHKNKSTRVFVGGSLPDPKYLLESIKVDAAV